MTTVTKHIESVLKEAECIYSQDEVFLALDRMANEITEELKDEKPIILCVMTGALVMTGHLMTRLHFPLELDYIHVTRYQGTTRGGDLHWLVEPRKSLAGRTVLIIDDILDGGLTLSAIKDYCEQSKAKQTYVGVLVDKKRKRENGVDLTPNFVGVEAENKYLFGFGLDYEEYLRNVPGIYALKA